MDDELVDWETRVEKGLRIIKSVLRKLTPFSDEWCDVYTIYKRSFTKKNEWGRFERWV